METFPFIQIVADFFEEWLTIVSNNISSGQLKVNGQYSYPKMLRIGESPDHFIAELIGATKIDKSNKYQIERPKSAEKVENTSSFFNPGFSVDDKQKAALTISTSNNKAAGICLCTKYDEKIFNNKINFPKSNIIVKSENNDVPLIIKPSCDFLIFSQVDLIRTDSFRILFRTISTAIIIKKTTNKERLINWLEEKKIIEYPPPIGIDILGLNPNSSTTETFARELCSLTSQQVNEPIIDRFINTNKSYFAEALGYNEALSKPRLQIINKKGWDKDYLEPDYLMKNENGTYDILDLKKALLTQKSITIGGKSRCRFNAYVNELIAQLNGYKNYFADEQNRKWALENKGIKINNPRLIGIVGDHNNFDKYKVEMALEQYKDSIVIISYEELINLLMKQR